MIQENIKFNYLRDVAEVDQFGWLDLRKALVDGTVKGDLVADEALYNDIDDPNAIMSGKPRDVFEAMELGSSLIKGVEAYNAAHASSEDNHD